MTPNNVCPYCGGPVAPERNVCPHCHRALPIPEFRDMPPPSAPSAFSPEPAPPPTPASSPQSPPEPLPGAFPPGGPYPPPPGQPFTAPPADRSDETLATVGLVLSCVGIATCGCLAILCPIGLILSIIAHHRRQSGVTVAGLIVGALGTLYFIASTLIGFYWLGHQMELIRAFERLGVPLPPGFPYR